MIAFCTIATTGYLPQARVLGYSLQKFHPQARLILLVPDAGQKKIDCEPFERITLEDLPQSKNLRDMCFYYNAFELSCALRGLLHQYLFEQPGLQKWIYLDTDTYVLGPLDPLLDLLDSNPIVLCQHASRPHAVEHAFPHEANVIERGIFNGGVLGLRRDDVSAEFIRWFASRLSIAAFSGYRGYFVDQLWLNLVPSFFPSAVICLHPGINLGHWNLHEREIRTNAAGFFEVNGLRLLLAHFSGWSMELANEVSSHAVMYRDHVPRGWSELADKYRQEFSSRGWQLHNEQHYAFASFSTGETIKPEMRIQYFEMLEKGGSLLQDPFRMHAHFRQTYLDRIKKYLIRQIAKTRRMMPWA